jgi:2-(1,2-epoxy-1,2-dihydrophenyl)acetyl-CoA isomerase
VAEEQELLIDRLADGVVVLTLNRPERLNAVTMDLQCRLDQALAELEADPEARCVVLTGAGERAFSAGYDVHEMAAWSADDQLLRLLEREAWVWHVAAAEIPIIAALNGITYGIGAIMASCVDIRIGSTAMVWRFTSGQHGGANATWSLPSLVGRGRAAELLMSGRKIEADEAEHIGLVNRVVEPARLLEEAVVLATSIAANPPAGMSAIKRLLREHEGSGIEARFVAENIAMRTELRPRPVGELYADFIKDRGGS